MSIAKWTISFFKRYCFVGFTVFYAAI